MKKLLTLLFMTAAMVITTSCDGDDDLPVSQPVQVNTFCYGDQTTNFETIGAFRGETLQVSGTGIRTQVTIFGEGISLNDMNELEGAGVLMQISFYGNSTDGFQTGLYEISDLQEPANATLGYDLDFDAANQLNVSLGVESGFIRVQTYLTGYAITIDGVDVNGDEFHGIYLGNVTLIE